MTKEILTDNMKLDFSRVLEIIQYHRTQAVQVINHASILTAWHVGAYVSNKIKNAKWGAKVVQQLAEYIHTQDPTLKGWSKVTIYRMVKLYDTYSSQQFVSYIAKLPAKVLGSQEIVSSEMTQLRDLSFRRSNENPSIGILMCKDANSEVVRYALNRSMSPTMISQYEDQLKVGSVLQRSLEEFTVFLADNQTNYK